METKEYDSLVRFFHAEGYGWRKAQEKADEAIERQREWREQMDLRSKKQKERDYENEVLACKIILIGMVTFILCVLICIFDIGF